MKTRNEKVLIKTPFVELVETEYSDMNDDIKKWVWVRRPNNRRAVVIAATHQDKLVLTKEYRIPLAYFEIGFPAGLIDKGETPEQAAIREFKEETGLDIDKIHDISKPIYSSAGMTNEAVHMVICTAKGTISQDMNEASEDITTYLKSREEVAEMLQDDDKLFGAKAYMLMQRFVMFGCLYKHRKNI